MAQAWSWLLAAGGLLVFWLAGNQNRWAWYVSLGLQTAWFTYGLVSRQWGFVASACAFSGVSVRNLLRHRVDAHADSGVR